MLGDRTIRDSNKYTFGLKPKFLGFDNLEKDGYFIGRRLDPVKLTDNFKLNLEPQFLIKDQYNNIQIVLLVIATSLRIVKRDTYFSEYFALDSEIIGKLNKWDLKISKKLNSFDSGKFLDASRFKLNLSREIEFQIHYGLKALWGIEIGFKWFIVWK